MNGLAIKFGTPTHGWLSVEALVDDQVYSEEVSDVPADSISELLGALIKLASGSGLVRVEWNLEPNSWLWVFSQADSEIEFQAQSSKWSSRLLDKV